MTQDDNKTITELLYELRLQRLENIRLKEQLDVADERANSIRQLRYLENIALIDQTIR